MDEDLIFDVIITGPYPDLDLCDGPGLNWANPTRAAAISNIIERLEKKSNIHIINKQTYIRIHMVHEYTQKFDGRDRRREKSYHSFVGSGMLCVFGDRFERMNQPYISL